MSQERADIQGAKDPPAGPQPGRIRTLNRARILQAAEEVFAEQGYRGATTAAIAGRAGLPKANLHYYFGTKEALYRAVLEGVLDLWLAELDAITADQNPGEALTRYIHAKVMYSKTRPHASRVFANEVIRGARPCWRPGPRPARWTPSIRSTCSRSSGRRASTTPTSRPR
jgi:TetR/AcrR family transcriptional regulator